MIGHPSKKTIGLVCGMIILLISSYLWALSTTGFRAWMAEWNMGRESYSAAIHWYTRALRQVDAVKDRELHRQLTEKLYRAYEGICNWDFESAQPLGWFAGQEIARLELGQGLLVIHSKGANPSIELIRISLSPSRKHLFQFRLRCRAGTQAQLLWAASTEIFTPDHLKTIPIKAGGEWEEHSVEIPPHEGGIGKCRLIPANTPGVIELDWIRINSVE